MFVYCHVNIISSLPLRIFSLSLLHTPIQHVILVITLYVIDRPMCINTYIYSFVKSKVCINTYIYSFVRSKVAQARWDDPVIILINIRRRVARVAATPMTAPRTSPCLTRRRKAGGRRTVRLRSSF